ncbi:MAG: haloacid dehalogenase [Desulfobacteraceae bacterium]|nr:haloacid dehalogenase [Desulfobacteraceae bacterium]
MIHPSEMAFDIDGVIADTMTLFIDIAREEFGIGDIRYEDIKEYSLNGIDSVDALTMVKIIDRILGGKHSGALAPLDGAVSVLQKLNQKHSPTLFVTARPDGEQAREWIINTLCLAPDCIEIVATGSFDDKREVLLNKGITYFVEDRLETCFTLSKVGIHPIVFKQPWNRKPHPFCEVENWQELESLIILD